VVEMLVNLKKKKLIDYQPKSDKPRITFIEERLPPENLKFDSTKIEFLYKVRSDNVAAMLHFIENKTVCRNRIILEYFNEQSSQNCGGCDVCRDRVKQVVTDKDFEATKLKIIELLSSNELSLHQLGAAINAQELAGDVIEWMVNNGEVKRTTELKFRLTTASINHTVE